MKNTLVILLAMAVASSQAQLYGVGGTNGSYSFYSINTTTGAATNLFNFAVPGTVNVVGLTYVSSTGKFLTSADVTPFSSKLVEIDLGAQTGTAVSTGIPNNGNGTPYFEGLEYMPSIGGVVVSYGQGGYYSGQLALINPVGYGLLNSTSQILADGDTLFDDGTGTINVMDSNNPTGGFQRNKVSNAFTTNNLTGFGSNMFSGTDSDFAWKADEGRLFVTQGTQLATVNGSSTSITTVGGYGIVNSTGVVGTITGIAAVPEPTSLAVLALGALSLLKKRRA